MIPKIRIIPLAYLFLLMNMKKFRSFGYPNSHSGNFFMIIWTIYKKVSKFTETKSVIGNRYTSFNSFFFSFVRHFPALLSLYLFIN